MISLGTGIASVASMGGSSPLPPDPSTVTGLGLWLEDVANVFSDTSRTTPATDGGNVAGWTDRSASARHATQVGSSFQPIYASTGTRGIAFEANDSLSLASNVVVGTNSTIYVVFYWPDTAGKGQYFLGDGGSVSMKIERLAGNMYLTADDFRQIDLGAVSAGLKLLKFSRNTGQVARFTGRATGGSNVLSGIGYSGTRTVNRISTGLATPNTMKLRAVYVFPSNYYADDSAEDLVVRNWIESTYGVNF